MNGAGHQRAWVNREHRRQIIRFELASGISMSYQIAARNNIPSAECLKHFEESLSNFLNPFANTHSWGEKPVIRRVFNREHNRWGCHKTFSCKLNDASFWGGSIPFPLGTLCWEIGFFISCRVLPSAKVLQAIWKHCKWTTLQAKTSEISLIILGPPYHLEFSGILSKNQWNFSRFKEKYYSFHWNSTNFLVVRQSWENQ